MYWTHKPTNEMENPNPFADHTPESLSNLLSSKNLNGRFPDIRGIYHMLLGANDIDWDNVPEELSKGFVNHIKEIDTMLRDISYVPDNSQTDSDRFKKANQSIDHAVSLFGINNNSLMDRAKYLGEFFSIYRPLDLRPTAIEHLDSIKENAATIEGITKEIEDIHGIVALKGHANNFIERSKKFKWASVGWLCQSVVCRILALNISVPFIPLPFIEWGSNNGEILQLAISTNKIAAVSMLLGYAWWCSKNRKVCQHNYITNVNKQETLNTLDVFMKHSDKDEVKQHVLKSATTAIFSPSPTGYENGSVGNRFSAHFLPVNKGKTE